MAGSSESEPTGCARCGGRTTGVLAGTLCPSCLLAGARSREPDEAWLEDRFPQLRGGRQIGGAGVLRFAAEEAATGDAVLLELVPAHDLACGVDQSLAKVEQRAQLDHPSVARVRDYGSIDSYIYAISDRPKGRTLGEAIGDAGVSRADILRVLPEITAAVSYAAGRGVSLPTAPETIFIDEQGSFTICGLLPDEVGTEGAGRPAAWIESHPAVGTKIGPYELVEAIGEGGFAEVYRARQETPMRREVALKILKLGMDTRQVLARFARERQALALMSHSSIAKIYDAGATSSGRPFIAMELVDGDPVTAYCDRRSMPLTDRAALLAQICRAVDHGNGKGVIHRDLKPSNLLIAEEDGKPSPKVIDFGIARAAEEPLTASTFFTRTQQFVGSPSYMSPEQIDGTDNIDARSDVYSLGCVLYELLTGSPPLPESELGDQGLKAVIEKVQAGAVEHPADRVARLPDAEREALAKARGTSPGQHVSDLAGRGLSEVALKALAKPPDSRYGSAADLAADLDAYAGGGTVSAPRRRRRSVRRLLAACAAGTAMAAAWALASVLLPTDDPPVTPASPPSPERRPAISRGEDGELRPVALFQFDGNLESAIAGGPPLVATGAPELRFETAQIGGELAQVMHFPRLLPSQWFKFENTIGVNGPPNATETNRWTLVMDVKFPSLTGPTALFQCHSENHGDAEMYVGPEGIGSRFGLFYGDIREGEWYRIAIVSTENGRAQIYANYVNGSRWGIPWVKGMHSAGYAFDDEILLFCEGDQKTAEGYVNSIAFYDVPLTDAELHTLGPPTAAGIPPVFKPAPAPASLGTFRARQRLTANDAQRHDHFAGAISIASDEAWVTALHSDISRNNAGSIYRYRRDAAGDWRPSGRVPLPGALNRSAGFGRSTAVADGVGIAGAPGLSGGGGAFLFQRAGDGWSPAVKLAPPENTDTGEFGHAVALNAGFALVGAPGGEGAVYLFDARQGAPAGKLSPGTSGQRFGQSISSAGGRVAVASPSGGPVAVFAHAPGRGWALEAAIASPPGRQGFGTELALSPGGSWLAASCAGGQVDLYQLGAGAAPEATGSLPPVTGVDSYSGGLAFASEHQLLVGAPEATWDRRLTGAVLLFEPGPPGSPWRWRRTIVPASGGEESRFGRAIAANGNQLWVGAPEDHTDRDSGGAAFPIDLPRLADQSLATISPTYNLGTDVALDGSLAAAGSPGIDGRAIGGQLQLFRLADGRWEVDPRFSHGIDPIPTGSFPRVDLAGDRLIAAFQDRVLVFGRQGETWSSIASHQLVYPGDLATDGQHAIFTHNDGATSTDISSPELGAPLPLPVSAQIRRSFGITLKQGTAVLPTPGERVVVLRRGSGSAWQRTAVLEEPEPAPPGTVFGHDTDTTGRWVIVGAPTRQRIASGIGANEGIGTGVAYVFDLENQSAPPAILRCPGCEAGEMPSFAHSVAIDGDLALVANPYVDRGLSPGRVYAFRFDPVSTRWSYVETLQAEAPEPGDEFGIQLDLDRRSGWAIIAAKTESVSFVTLPPEK